MTQQEWDNATDEERADEYERCKNPVYFYNNYWITANGLRPPPITQEQWNEQVNYFSKPSNRKMRF